MAYQPLNPYGTSYPEYIRQAVASRGALATGPQSYGSLVSSVNNLRNNYAGQFGGNVQSTIRNMLAARSGSPFSPVIGTPVAGTGTAGNDGFGLVKVSKDPTGRFDRIGQSALDRVESFRPDYGQARTAASGAVDLLNRGDSDLGANRGDAESLIAKWKRISPELDTQVATQTAAINRVYDPNGLRKELAGNTQAAADAERLASTRAINNALFQARLHSAGGAGSSYTNLQAADAAGRIAEETAARTADRRRQDTAALLAAQERNLGRTQDLATQQVLRERIPIETRNGILDQEAKAAAQRLAAAGQQVNIDQLTDELSTVARQLGISGQALQQYLAANFTGVRKEGEDYPLFVNGLPTRSTRPQAYFPEYNPSSDYLGDYRRPTAAQPSHTRSQIEEIYRANAGVYPDQDPNFSPELFSWAQRNAPKPRNPYVTNRSIGDMPPAGPMPMNLGYPTDMPPAGPIEDQALLNNYYYPDEAGNYLY